MKLCLVYNFAQHYRTNIFKLLDSELDIDFVFGDHYLDVKKMDYRLLKHKVTEVKNHSIGPMDWQSGVIEQIFKGYNTFIMLGEPMNITTWMMLVLGRLLNKKVILWTHGWYGKEGKSKTIIKKCFFGLAYKTMTYGNYARKLMIDAGLDASKIVVIHNSLMYDEQIKMRKMLTPQPIYKEHFSNESPVLVFIGRLTKKKKLEQLLLAQKSSTDRGIEYNVVFIGDGEENDTIRRLAIELEIDEHVWFYGPSYNEQELAALLYNADLCVAPGNIGLTAMHAMVYGCPCISHSDFPYQMPEFEAIKDGMTGSFFQRDNIVSLAKCIEKWLSSNSARREEIRQNCYMEIDNNWNPHKQLDIIKTVIES